MTPSGRRARRFATFGSLYCLCLTRWQQHSTCTCCMPRVCCRRVRAWPCRGAKLRAARAVRSIHRGRQRSGTASQRAYPDCVARAWGRPASKKTADARLICIPIIIRVGRASRNSLGGRFPSVPAVLAVAALPLLGAAVRHAACARGRHCRSCSLHVVHVHA